MSEEVKKYLLDIRDSIESIYSYLGSTRDFNVYRGNKGLRRSIERELEIIGLALNNAIKLQSDLKITDKRKIIGTRNMVAHAYDKIQDEVIWSIIVNHLPLLLKEVNEIYNS